MIREKIYLKCGHTDMRRGIDGLAGVVLEELGLKVCDEQAMFIFCGRKKNRYKILYWERDGSSCCIKELKRSIEMATKFIKKIYSANFYKCQI